MHFNMKKGFKIITLHSNFQTFFETLNKKKVDVRHLVLNTKLILVLTILKKYMQENDALKFFRFST